MTDFAQKDADLSGPGPIPTDAPPDAIAAPEPAPRRPALTFGEAIPEPTLGHAPPPDMDAGSTDILGAAWRYRTIRIDAWAYEGRQRQELASAMFDRLPPEAQARIQDARRHLRPNMPEFADLVTAEAARLVQSGPEAAADWAGFPLSPDAFNQRMLAERQAERDAARSVLDQPGGAIMEFIGEAARDLTDRDSLAMLPLGIGGGAVRTITTEAVLGAAGEAAVLPREFEVAERLGEADPDPLTRILTGAALGGGLSAGVLGIAKGLGWLKSRRAGTDASRPAAADPLDHAARVDAAEAALTGTPGPLPARAPAANTQGTPAAPGTLGAVLADAPPATSEDAVLNAIIGVESGGNPNAKAATSSATGLGQFIGSTWLDMIARHRPDLMQGRTKSQVLELRKDSALSREMTRLYMRENQAQLRAAGVANVGPGETYLAHFMGPSGAIRTLTSAPETPIQNLMSPREIAANAGIRFNGKSFAQFTAFDLRMWAQKKMGRAYDGAPPPDVPAYSPTTRGYTGQGQVTAGDGFRIDVDYQVVDASDLIRASGEFQPRDRSRGTSDAWIADTAARLDPAQLMPGPTADRGAPIVGPDGMIESGNGRFGAIERAYERHPDRAAAYRAQIEAAGFTIPEGIERPVLIARRTTDLSREDRVRFTIDAQDSGVAVMTPTEVARAQSRAMTPDVLARLDPAQPITAEANAPFVRAALAGLPRSARNAMFDAAGLLNRDGERQLRQAIFARAWPDPDIVTRATETDAGDLKGLFTALEQSAPDWAALKADIAAGTVSPDMDIGAFVLDAMRLIANARDLAARDGIGVKGALDDLLAEVDLLDGAISPLTAAMVRRFYPEGRPARADDVASLLSRYAQDARKAGQTDALFGAPGPRDVLAALDARHFADLPADIGRARGRTEPPATPDPAPLPDPGFAKGAASPEAAEAAATIRADLDSPPDPAPIPAATDAADTPGLTAVDDPLADLRTLAADAPDMTIRLPDGTDWSARDILADLDADTAADAVIRACGITPTGA